MFRYIFKVIALLLQIALTPRKSAIHDTSVIQGRVMPSDVDFNAHFNNGLIQTAMDFGRFDLLIRMGILRLVLKEKWRPIVGSTCITFRKPLPLFAAYQIHSQIVGWDEKWVYFEQKLSYHGKIAAHSFIKALVRGPRGNIPPSEIAFKLGVTTDSPPLPRLVTEWKKADDLLLQTGNGQPDNVPATGP